MLDSIFIGVVVLFAVLGAVTGLLLQVLRLAAAAGGAMAALSLSGPAIKAWPVLDRYPALQEILFPLVIFVASYVVLSLIARLVVAVFRKTAPVLSWADRLWGALVGALKGVVLVWFTVSVLLAAEASTGRSVEHLGTRDSRVVALVREWPVGRAAELAKAGVEEVRVDLGKVGEKARDLGGKAVDTVRDAGAKAVEGGEGGH